MNRWTVLSKCPVICLQVCIARLKERPQNKYTPFKQGCLHKSGNHCCRHTLSFSALSNTRTPRPSLPDTQIFPAKVTSPPLSVFLPLSYFSPHPPCIHTLSVHLPIHIPLYPSTAPHHISFQLSGQRNSISLKLIAPFSVSLYEYRPEAFEDLREAVKNCLADFFR